MEAAPVLLTLTYVLKIMSGLLTSSHRLSFVKKLLTKKVFKITFYFYYTYTYILYYTYTYILNTILYFSLFLHEVILIPPSPLLESITSMRSDSLFCFWSSDLVKTLVIALKTQIHYFTNKFHYFTNSLLYK